MTAKINHLQMNNYGSTPSGTVSVSAGTMSSQFNLTRDEAEQLAALAAKFYNNRKAEFAKTIEATDPTPLALSGPAKHAIDLDDEVPF